MSFKTELLAEGGVSIAAHARHNVAQVQLLINHAGRTDADDVFHAVEIVQLIGVNADGGHAHAAGHDRNALALVKTRVALHAADVVDEFGVGEISVRDEFGAERVAGHQHGAGKISGCRRDVRSGDIRHNKTSCVVMSLDK